MRPGTSPQCENRHSKGAGLLCGISSTRVGHTIDRVDTIQQKQALHTNPWLQNVSKWLRLQERGDPWQQICDLWERLTGQTLTNVDDAAPIPCTQFVTRLCEHFLGRPPSDVERSSFLHGFAI